MNNLKPFLFVTIFKCAKQNGISILDRIDYIEDSDQNKKFIQNEF